MIKEAEVKFTCEDDLYAEWYECLSCGYSNIAVGAKFCAGCGFAVTTD